MGSMRYKQDSAYLGLTTLGMKNSDLAFDSSSFCQVGGSLLEAHLAFWLYRNNSWKDSIFTAASSQGCEKLIESVETGYEIL